MARFEIQEVREYEGGMVVLFVVIGDGVPGSTLATPLLHVTFEGPWTLGDALDWLERSLGMSWTVQSNGVPRLPS